MEKKNLKEGERAIERRGEEGGKADKGEGRGEDEKEEEGEGRRRKEEKSKEQMTRAEKKEEKGILHVSFSAAIEID